MARSGGMTVSAYGSYSPPPPITLQVTSEMMETLKQISRDSGQPLEIVFTRAIGLYQAALGAAVAGNHVGYAASSDALDVEFTGFVGPEGR